MTGTKQARIVSFKDFMLFRLPFKGAMPHSEFLDIAPFGYLL